MWEGVGKKKGSEGKEGWNGRVIELEILFELILYTKVEEHKNH